MTLRVAAYCRVSTDSDEQHNSLESQRSYFRDYIGSKENWELAEVYYDEGVSGTSTRRRTGFNRMIDDAEAGKIDLIITKEVSRFARNTVDTLSYTRRLKEMGAGVIFINDNINTLEPDGELRLTIMASIAQEESRKTSERVKWGQKRRMEQGVVFGRSLLGYDVREGKLYINSEGAETVRLIFNKYVNERKGTHVIARELTESGICPMYVSQWSSSVILRILRNEKYTGDLWQKKTYTPDYLNHKRKYNKGAEEKVFIENHHEPIITRSLWNEAQRLLAVRVTDAEHKSRYSSRYWCSGKVVCGDCGSAYVSRTKYRKDGSTYKAWRCGCNAKYGAEKLNSFGNMVGCNNLSVNEQVLSEAVSFALKSLNLSKTAVINEIAAEITALTCNTDKQDICRIRKNIRSLEYKKQTLLDRYLEGIVASEDYRQQNSLYDEQIRALNERITHHMIHSETNNDEWKVRCMEYVNRCMSFEALDDNVYGELLEKITVFRDKTLEVKLKFFSAIRMCYSTSGRGEGYRVNIDYK